MLTTRQQSILRLIVDDYVKTAAPIASDVIARNHDVGVSPATIRNDVASLEEEGYITRPHPSAGSVPLDKAYRAYVESLLDSESADDLPLEIRMAARRRLSVVEQDIEGWGSVAAGILAQLVGNMAIATFPKAKEARIKHIELVDLNNLRLMYIVVLEQAYLRRQLIRLENPVDPSELEASANKVKSTLLGRTSREIEAKHMDLTPLEEELIDASILILREEENAIYRDHYVDGLRNLLNQPEFAENEKVRSLIEGVENGSLIQAVLEETPVGGVVRVIIGQENRGDLLWPMSVVICQYGVPNEAVGAVGAIGPTRMEYSKTIAGVKFMSSVLSDLFGGVASY